MISRLTTRALLAALLVGTAAVKVSSAPDGNSDFRSSAAAIVGQRGLIHGNAPGELPIFVTAPGCDRDIVVLPLTLNMQEAALLNDVTEPDYARHFFYVDRAWTSRDRFNVKADWLKRKVLSFVGLDRHVQLHQALVVAEPPNCEFARTIDWRPLWRRHSSAAL
jgi:hypothetical protein